MTMDTTAHRFIRVRAADCTQAQEQALAVARDEGGAHFTINEGNFVRPSDVHINSVFDASGDEVWNDSEGEVVVSTDTPV